MKRLAQSGNSVVLVIDKPILDRMKLRRGSIVEYQIQDGRLVVQPSKHQPPPLEIGIAVAPPKPMPMPLVMRGLDGLDFGRNEAARFFGDPKVINSPMDFGSYCLKAANGLLGELVELRLRALFERRRKQPMFRAEPWETTIDAVLAAFPDLETVKATAHKPVGIEHLL